MSEYNEGDLIEAEKKEIASSTRFRGLVEVVQSNVGPRFYIAAQGCNPEIAWLEERGFTLTVIEKAKPKLPEEPSAIYSVIKFRSRIPAMLHEDRLWYFVGYPGYMRARGQQRGQTWEELITACGTSFELLAVQS